MTNPTAKAQATTMKKKTKAKNKKDWASYDRVLVQRGEMLIPFGLAEDMEQELAEMNSGKEGAQFRYTDRFMECLSFWKCFCKLPYRAVEGIAGRLLNIFGLAGSKPDHTTINRRLNKLGKKFCKERRKDKTGEPIFAVFDGSGLKVCNRGEWMHYKHKGKRKGFVRICFLINAKTGEIIDFIATTENVSEQSRIRPMIKRAARNRKIGKLAVDGIGDDYRNFELLRQLKIKPALKPRANANPDKPIKDKRHKARHREIKLFKKWGYDEWARKRDYNQRWLVETAFSCFKGYFDEYVYSRGMSNIKAEIGLKVHCYNQLKLVASC